MIEIVASLAMACMRSPRPGGRGDHSQPRDSFELGGVAARDAQSMRERSCRDPKIVRADQLAANGEPCPDIRVRARDRLCDRDCLQLGEQVLDERASARALRSLGTMHAVEQLADSDDTDRSVLAADRLLDGWVGDAALEVDEHVGIDQDRHASSGGPTESRAARTSSRKRSSGGGAVATSSRNRSADISRDFGGEITATSAPLLVTSISSPAATLLSSSEKLRAASVAVMRLMSPGYQINQTIAFQGERVVDAGERDCMPHRSRSGTESQPRTTARGRSGTRSRGSTSVPMMP